MTGERAIRLDVSVPDLGARAGQQERPGGGSRQLLADAQDRQRFEQSLASASPEDAPDGERSLPSPLDLLGGHRPAVASAPRMEPAMPAFDAGRLGDTLSRLMVGDGRSGGRQVRMALKDDVLPGVSVVIEEVDGRLQVDFICSVEDSRLKLVQALPEQAPVLARRLGRDVLLRVQTDDEEDLRLTEVAASA